ncbi:MAG TPA: hypothetical protein VM580_16530 [Labilithrix sp.]|nr:hypothetical protein [Labilithrix sp.]
MWKAAAGALIASLASGIPACTGEDPPFSPGINASDGGLDGSSLDGAPLNDAGVATCDADLTSDPAHCGACGHACAGCAAGLCPVTTLRTGLSNPYALLLDGQDLFFSTVSFPGALSNKHAVHQYSLGANSEGPLVATKRSFVAGLAVTSSELFWTDLTNNGEVARCTRSGCSSPEPFATIGSTPYGIVVVGSNVYWANRDGQLIQSCPLSGSCTPTTTANVDPKYPTELATDGSSLFWTAFDLSLDEGGAVYRCSLPNCSDVTAFATNQKSPSGIAVFGGNVYWANSGTKLNQRADGSIWTATTAGTDARELIRTTNALRIAVDATGFYWTSGGSEGSILRCPLAGCAGKPLALAIGQRRPAGLALGQSHVFWLNGGTLLDGGSGLDDGTLMSVVK